MDNKYIAHIVIIKLIFVISLMVPIFAGSVIAQSDFTTSLYKTSQSRSIESAEFNPTILRISRKNIYSISELTKVNRKNIQTLILDFRQVSSPEELITLIERFPKVKNISFESYRYTNIEVDRKTSRLLSKLEGINLKNVHLNFPNQSFQSKKLKYLGVDFNGISSEDVSSLVKQFEKNQNVLELTIDITSKVDEYLFTFISKFKNLSFLNFNMHSFSKIPLLENLKGLRLSNAEKISLEGINEIRKLEKLIIVTYRKGVNLHEDFYKLNHLKELKINVDEFGDGIANFTNLKIADIHIRNKLPDSFFDLPIEKLTLNGNLKNFTFSNLTKFTELKSLKINANINSDDFLEIYKLESLEELYLDKSHTIRTLPEGIENLSELKSISINCSGIESFPSNFKKLTKLKRIDLGGTEHNRRYFEEELAFNFQRKRSLFFDPLLEGLATFTDLEYFNLSYHPLSANRLKEILSVLSKHTHISVNLSSCNIFNLPNQFWDNLHFNSLDLTKNRISELPKLFFDHKIDHVNLDPYLQKNSFVIGKSDVAEIQLLLNSENPIIDQNKKRNYLKVIGQLSKQFDVAPFAFVRLAFQIDKKKASKYFNSIDVANYHFKNHSYKKALSFYKKDSESIFHSAEQTFNYAICLLKNGQLKKYEELVKSLPNSLKDLNIRHSSVDVKIAILTQPIDSVLSLTNLNSLFFDLQSKVQYDNCQKNSDYTNLLEYYLISNQLSKFDKLYFDIVLNKTFDPEDEIILHYLYLIKQLSVGKINEIDLQRLRNLSNSDLLLGWDSAFLDLWCLISEFEYSDLILEANSLVDSNARFSRIQGIPF